MAMPHRLGKGGLSPAPEWPVDECQTDINQPLPGDSAGSDHIRLFKWTHFSSLYVCNKCKERN
jgi:hypothetical protein